MSDTRIKIQTAAVSGSIIIRQKLTELDTADGATEMHLSLFDKFLPSDAAEQDSVGDHGR